eukprot:2970859-Alexandrium_andersonii.AAC.1
MHEQQHTRFMHVINVCQGAARSYGNFDPPHGQNSGAVLLQQSRQSGDQDGKRRHLTVDELRAQANLEPRCLSSVCAGMGTLEFGV